MRSFDTRTEMLGMVPQGGVVCEVGVYRGDFADRMLAICEPSEMVLIDAWPDRPISTGDEDGLNIVEYNGLDLLRMVRERFSDEQRVKIVRGLSNTALAGFNDDYFDMVYIDADHDRAAVAGDIALAHAKVKPGGYIMGHDYLTNPAKNPVVWTRFGVKEAVDEFCEATGYSIDAMAYDGNLSFAIQVR